MGRALGDTGLHLLMVIAVGAVMLEGSDLQSVKQVVANPHNDCKSFDDNLLQEL